MRTGRGFERLVNFSDAVVAIAITLLVLPLVDLPDELPGNEGVGQLFSDHRSEILSYVISFVVIWRLWSAHHAMMEYFRGYDRVLLPLHMVWLFTIATIPFTTGLLFAKNVVLEGGTAVYVALLLVSAVALFAIELRGRTHQELLHPDHPDVRRWLGETVVPSTAVILLVTLVVIIIWPQVGAWPLLLLMFDTPLVDLYTRLRGGRTSAGDSGVT